MVPARAPMLVEDRLNTGMTKKPTKHTGNAEEQKIAAQERRATAAIIAKRSHDAEQLAKLRGNNKPITNEMKETGLEMLSHGYPMDVVTKQLGISRSALLSLGTRDSEFAERLRAAMAMGTVDIINATFRIANGEEGFTTGSIERDKLKCEMAWRYAKTIGNRIFGDKLQVDQRTITINVNPTETDW